MTSVTPVNSSLASLAKALRTAFKLNHRRQPRVPASGSLHLFFQPQEGEVSSDLISLHDTFTGGLAFRSARLFCVGSHVCLSDGVEAMEVSIEFRRKEQAEFVYVVNLNDLSPLPAVWRERLDSTATMRLQAILARCQVHGEKAVNAE